LRAIDEVHWVNSGGVRSANAHQTSTDDVREMGGKEETDIEELPDIGGGKSRALFELLMCNPGGCSLEELNAAIWDGDVLLPSIRRTIDRLNKNLRLKGSSFMVVQDEKTKNFSLQGMRSDKHGQTLRQSCPT
jgi:hypothetical protein